MIFDNEACRLNSTGRFHDPRASALSCSNSKKKSRHWWWQWCWYLMTLLRQKGWWDNKAGESAKTGWWWGGGGCEQNSSMKELEAGDKKRQQQDDQPTVKVRAVLLDRRAQPVRPVDISWQAPNNGKTIDSMSEWRDGMKNKSLIN